MTNLSKTTRDKLRGSNHLTSDAALRVRYILTQLENPKSDKRKLRIKKRQYLEWFRMVHALVHDETLDPEKFTDEQNNVMSYFAFSLFLDRISIKAYNKIKLRDIRLNKTMKKAFLRMVDNAFLHILADIGFYPNSQGTKLLSINQMHPNHYDSVVKKMIKQGYQLPRRFKPEFFIIDDE